MSTWNGSPQRELTTNPLSGKLGADQIAPSTSQLPLSGLLGLSLDDEIHVEASLPDTVSDTNTQVNTMIRRSRSR